MQPERDGTLYVGPTNDVDIVGSNVFFVRFSSLTMFDAYTGADLMSITNHGLPNSTNPIRPKKLDPIQRMYGLGRGQHC